MNDTNSTLDEVLKCEIKSFKLNFLVSGVFEESDMFGGYSYTVELIYWNSIDDNRSIITKTRDDL